MILQKIQLGSCFDMVVLQIFLQVRELEGL